MNWAILAQLILTHGLPLAERLWQKWAEGKEPTQADWDELKALAAMRARDRMLLALERAGIAADSDAGKALLAQV